MRRRSDGDGGVVKCGVWWAAAVVQAAGADLVGWLSDRQSAQWEAPPLFFFFFFFFFQLPSSFSSSPSLTPKLSKETEFGKCKYELSDLGINEAWTYSTNIIQFRIKALNEIKASLGWRVVYSWVGDDPCGDGDLPPWSGVTCSQQGDYRVVTELEVYAVSIVGPFPTAVTNLLDLTRLDLHNNKLTGPIPPQIGRLKHLKILNLRWNKLQDILPPEIGELKKLTHLYLSFNNFKGEIPVELANLPELRYLYLHENRFTGKIPPELGNLKHLRHLDVGNNHLTGTLRDFVRSGDGFPSLRNLYLNNNHLSGGLPDQLANLTNLEILHLSYNKMIGAVTPKLVQIPRLTYLDHNLFTGRIPEGLYKHPFLKEMYIEGNQFKPSAKPKGTHKVLELADTDFLF
ncbi:putative leucine-rich repeat receptor-like protein kinase [Ananas comosus]|uniref:Putative leucine-rich repeat receptor-like protein kinase n=1 Tax=Ananas comosus TaxID=4615 RepID=A0A199URZ8_ANACO|nr:putative leucine-rich repeat receptor-like protein kinase [Ananas comosus]